MAGAQTKDSKMKTARDTRKETTSKARNKSKSKTVDPDRPKRPQTSYFAYCADERAKAKKKDKDAKIATKELSESWKELETKKKNKYESVYKADLEAWKEECIEYDDNLKEEKNKENKPKIVKLKEVKRNRVANN